MQAMTMFGLFLGISTYRRSCLNCGLMYRYQEWEDGLHNFDDHILLSLHLCLMFRNTLQVRTCHSKLCSARYKLRRSLLKQG